MNMVQTRLLVIALVIGASLISKMAFAAPITATWTGTLGNISSSYNLQTGATNSLSGMSIVMSFTYDASAVNASLVTDNPSYRTFSGVNASSFYSLATVSLGNGLTFTLPPIYSEMGLGDQTKADKDRYLNYADDGANFFSTSFRNSIGGTTTLLPSQTFSHVFDANDTSVLSFNFTSSGVRYSAYSLVNSGISSSGGGWSSLVVSGGDPVPVPAPGALALLGLGLLGICGLRKRVSQREASGTSN